MNYYRIYNNLINRSINRTISTKEYYELHHIIPKCMYGDDTKDNLVLLTAREHYVAHQLLVKIYPGNTKLVYAANMMTVKSAVLKRSKNRRYEWIRKKFAAACSVKQLGSGNNSYGTTWITNYGTKQSIRIHKSELEEYIQKGWSQERKINFDTGNRLQTFKCRKCHSEFNIKTVSRIVNFCTEKCRKDFVYYNSETYKMFNLNKDSIRMWYEAGCSLNKICKYLGLPGAQGGYFTLLKRFIKEWYPVPDSN